MAFIYKITNTLNNKSYIGKTTFSIDKRYQEHLSDSRKKNSKSLISKKIKQYGSNYFECFLLEECDDLSVNDREKYYISELNPEYNQTQGGDGGSTTHNKRWITNGEKDLYINKCDQLPDGFRYGRTNTVFNDPEKQRQFGLMANPVLRGKKIKEVWDEGRMNRPNHKTAMSLFKGEGNVSKRPEVREKMKLKWVGRDTTNLKIGANRRSLRKIECEICSKVISENSKGSHMRVHK